MNLLYGALPSSHLACMTIYFALSALNNSANLPGPAKAIPVRAVAENVYRSDLKNRDILYFDQPILEQFMCLHSAAEKQVFRQLSLVPDASSFSRKKVEKGSFYAWLAAF